MRLLVARPKLSWPDLMHFQVAVRTDAQPTAVHVADPLNSRKAAKHLLVGDEAGVLYVFAMDGRLLLQHDSGLMSGITALSETRLKCGSALARVYQCRRLRYRARSVT